MTTEQTKLTKREVVAFLRECGFDPKETGTRLNVAARTDKDYCLNRAIEEISGKPKKANIIFAIQLLTLGGVLGEQNQAKH